MAAPSPSPCHERLSLLHDLQTVAQLRAELCQRCEKAFDRQDDALLEMLGREVETARLWEAYFRRELGRHLEEHRCN